MATELKFIFEGLDNVKKKIEDGFKSGIELEAKTQESSFGKRLQDLNKQFMKSRKQDEKIFRQNKLFRKQQDILKNATKGLQFKIKDNNNIVSDLQNKIQKYNDLFGRIGMTDNSSKIVDKLKHKLDKLVNQNEKMTLTMEKNDLTSKEISSKISGLKEMSAMLTGEQLENLEEQAQIQQAIVDSFSSTDKILYKIYNRLGMTGRKDKLIDKRLGGGIDGIGGKKGGGKEGGMSGKGLIGLAAVAGGIIGLLSQLIQSTKAIQFTMEFIGGLLNMLLAPILLVVLTLLKPFLIMFLLLSKYLFDFFIDPSKALENLWESIKTGLSNLLGFGGKEKQEGAAEGFGAIAGAGLGFAFGGPLGALIGAVIGPIIAKLAVGLGVWIGELLATFTLWLDDLTGGKITQIINGIVEYFSGLWDIIAGIFTLDWERIKKGFSQLASGLWNIITGVLGGSWEILKIFGVWMWEKIKEAFSAAWELLGMFGDWYWNKLKESFADAWELLSGFGYWIFDEMTSVLSTSLNVLSGIGQWIKDKMTDLWDGIKSTGSSMLDRITSTVGIGDGVVSPNGRLISINPKDYLLASKNPKDLMGGNSSGNNITINLTVNGNADRGMIDMIKRELRRELSAKGSF